MKNDGKGELVSIRRKDSDNESALHSECPYCHALMATSHLVKHSKRCIAAPEEKSERGRNLKQKSKVQNHIKLGIIGEELGSVLEHLADDEVGQIVMQDGLILIYGQTLVNQQLNEEMYRYIFRFPFPFFIFLLH